MKIPKKIKIGGHMVTIRKMRQLQEPETIGQAFNSEDRIDLATHSEGKPISEAMRAVVLLHEIVHHINWVYCGARLSEEDIQAIGEGLLQVLRDNNLDFSKKGRK